MPWPQIVRLDAAYASRETRPALLRHGGTGAVSLISNALEYTTRILAIGEAPTVAGWACKLVQLPNVQHPSCEAILWETTFWHCGSAAFRRTGGWLACMGAWTDTADILQPGKGELSGLHRTNSGHNRRVQPGSTLRGGASQRLWQRRAFSSTVRGIGSSTHPTAFARYGTALAGACGNRTSS